MYLKNTYISYPNLLIADVSDSDCRKARNQQEFSKKLLWDLNLYDITKNNVQNRNLTIIFNNIDKYKQYKKNLNENDIIIMTENIDKSYYDDNVRYYKASKIHNYIYMYCYTDFIFYIDNPDYLDKFKIIFNSNFLKYRFFCIKNENDCKNFIVSKYYFYTIGNLQDIIIYMKKYDLIMYI